MYSKCETLKLSRNRLKFSIFFFSFCAEAEIEKIIVNIYVIIDVPISVSFITFVIV